MRIKFTGRWNKQSLKKAICEAIEELQFYDIEFFSGVNLYFHGENINFDKIEIRNENDTPVMLIYDNNIPVIKPRKNKKRKAPVIRACHQMLGYTCMICLIYDYPLRPKRKR